MGWVRCGLGTPSNILALPTPSEASGAIARFNTDLTENLLSAVAEFNASQASGTPTPSAPIPIVGVDKVNIICCGKNLISHTSFGTFADWKADLVPFGDTPTSNANRGFALPTKAGQTYTISFGITDDSFPIYLYLCKSNRVDTSSRVAYITTNTKIMNRTYTFTANSDLYYLRMNTYDEPTFNTQVSKCSYEQLEFGNQATDYEVFQGITALINLGGTYYGGSVDAVTGKAYVCGRSKLSDLNWVYQEATQRFYTNSLANIIYKVSSYDDKMPNLKSEIETATTFNQLSGSLNGIATVQSGNIFLKASGYTDVNTLLADCGDTYITYDLATPIVVYASNTAEIPTIVGDNQVYADTGDVAVKYFETVGHKI